MINGPENGYGFGPERNHLSVTLEHYASWGHYEKGENNYRDGYQCPPVDWAHETDEASAFFEALDEWTPDV